MTFIPAIWSACWLAFLVLAWGALPAAASVESEVAFHRGIAAHGDGRLDDARKAFERVLADDPDDVDALHYLGLIAQQQGRPGDAVSHYERALELEREDPDLHFDYGTALLESGRPADARAAFEEVIRLQPERARAHYFAGIAAYRAGEYEESVASMNRATELDPELATEASYYTGLAEAYRGNAGAAVIALDVVTQSPQSPLADSATNMRDQLRPESPRRWSLALTLGSEFDSNPTLAGARFDLDRHDDARFVVRLRGGVRAWERGSFTLDAGYDGYLGVHTDESEVDLQTHVGFLSAGWELGTVRLGLRYDLAYSLLDLTDSFRLLNRVTSTVAVREQEWGLTQIYYQFNYSDFDSEPRLENSISDISRDGPRHSVGVNQFVFLDALGPLQYLRFGVAGDFYDADGEEFSYQAWEASAGFGLSLPLETELTALYRYVRRDYKDKSTFSRDEMGNPTTRRDDHIQLIFLDVGKTIASRWRVSLGGTASFNASDVGVFDYNRIVAGGYVTYRF